MERPEHCCSKGSQGSSTMSSPPSTPLMAHGSRAVDLLRVGLEQVQQTEANQPPTLLTPVLPCRQLCRVTEGRSCSLGLGRSMRTEKQGLRGVGNSPHPPPFYMVAGTGEGGCRAVFWSFSTSAEDSCSSVVGEPLVSLYQGIQCVLINTAVPCLKCPEGGGLFHTQLLWFGCMPGA